MVGRERKILRKKERKHDIGQENRKKSRSRPAMNHEKKASLKSLLFFYYKFPPLISYIAPPMHQSHNWSYVWVEEFIHLRGADVTSQRTNVCLAATLTILS